jgi:hemoglobin
MASSSPIPRQYHRPGGVSEKVDDTTIRAVVDRFYEIAREDSLLGPVFDAHVDDWPTHLETMYAFWGSVLCGEGRYQGNPFQKHLVIQELSADHFRRWLDLFSETLAAYCSAEDAAAWETTARRMGFAMSARLGFGQHPELIH